MKQSISIFTIALIIAGLGFYQYLNGHQKESISTTTEAFKPKPGIAAQTFSLPDLNDKSVTIGGQQNKLTFVNFWASWCGPCELEAPDLQKLHVKYGDSMQVYGVNATSYDKEREARGFVDKQGFTFPILMDRKGDVTKQYKVNTFPTTFLIDSNGIIRERVNGVITLEEWEQLIEKWM